MAKATPKYDKKLVSELKSSLLEKKSSLLQKLNTWEDKSSPSGLKEMGDFADMASNINEETLSSVLTENEIDLLNQIEGALNKIEKGTYGICEGTGKKIPIARLKAIPWTLYTIEYAEIAAKNKKSARPDYSAFSASSGSGSDSENLD
ncbi:MAG: TraR/DksA family transcriptional regulator [Leptospiraceae bacterium]|nr:TraR/DksA family transcriptional regulator [Leptospiraceae bacterium]MCK6380786.1 TraR/DksA family transcriptional regulator [Leptospiraceae bacterium]NUM40497.1 TraR/DksA family transcriptional regulator [Leptospiraceae bacterium]